MELTVNDKIVANPTAADISRALDADSFPDGWAITLDTETGASLDAIEEGHGAFHMTHADNDRRRLATPNPDAATVKAVFLKYFAGAHDWDQLCEWTAPGGKSTKSSTSLPGQPLKPPPPGSIQAIAARKLTPFQWARGLIGIALIAGAIYWVAVHGFEFIEGRFPRAEGKLAVLTACMGLFTLLIFLGSYRYSKRAQNWPSVRGTVVGSRVEKRSDTTDRKTTTTYEPVIEYTYRVAGQDYRSKQFKLGMTFSSSRSYADGVIAKYRIGDDIEVHYDPDNPSQAALENPTGATWMILAVAVFLFGVTIYALHIFG